MRIDFCDGKIILVGKARDRLTRKSSMRRGRDRRLRLRWLQKSDDSLVPALKSGESYVTSDSRVFLACSRFLAFFHPGDRHVTAGQKIGPGKTFEKEAACSAY